MRSPYEIGALYVLNRRERNQQLQPWFAIVAEVHEHELVLTDVRVAPDAPVVHEHLVMGRAEVAEARLLAKAAPKPTGTEDTDKVGGGRRITVKG